MDYMDIAGEGLFDLGEDSRSTAMAEACRLLSSRNIRLNYVGNKRRILPAIWSLVNSRGVPHSTVFDVFGGSGVVSSFFALMGSVVSYNDILMSSCVQASCLLSGAPRINKDKVIQTMTDPSGLSACQMARSEMVGKFLTEAEAEFVDRYIGNVFLAYGLPEGDSVFDSQGADASAERNFLIGLLIFHVHSTCFIGGRYYNGQVIAKKEHRLGHDRNKGIELHKSLMETYGKMPVIPYPGNSRRRVVNSDALTAVSRADTEADLLYIDPPYGGESSDYATLYGFAEKCARGGAGLPERSMGNASAFKGAKAYSEKFTELLKGSSRYKNWVISFNRTSFASLDEIRSLVESCGRKTHVETAPISYNYRKDRRVIKLGESTTDENGVTRRMPTEVLDTDDELLILAGESS